MPKETVGLQSAIILAAKRSGTNFVHGVLSPFYSSAVMEPVGLHNESPSPVMRNPIDPWNYSSPEDISEEFGHRSLKDDPYGVLLVKNFLCWLKEAGKLVKETDLLPMGWLLRSVPLLVVTISRDPRDSIASFKRDDLYTQWGYREKMERFARTVESSPELRDLYGGFTSSENITMLPKHRQLAYYYAVALREIERTTTTYNPLRISYEELVTDPFRVFGQLCEFLTLPYSIKMKRLLQDRTTQTRSGGVHGTFRSNNNLHTFQNILTSQEEADIRGICQELGVPLEAPSQQAQFPTTKWVEFEKHEKKLDIIAKRSRKAVAVETVENSVSITIQDDPIHIAKYLVTNEQYAQFLYWLKRYDIPIAFKGKPIFYNDRPQSRLHYNDIDVLIDQGFERHPVTYVNWLGASVYAAWIGGRVPFEQEWVNAVYPQGKQPHVGLSKDLANFAEHYGGTTPVGMFPPNIVGIYDALGNASIWLADVVEENTFEAKRQGIGWNHTEERLDLLQKRPYWLGASGLGIRPVFDDRIDMIGDVEMAHRVEDIVAFLTQESHCDVISDNKKLRVMIQCLTK